MKDETMLLPCPFCGCPCVMHCADGEWDESCDGDVYCDNCMVPVPETVWQRRTPSAEAKDAWQPIETAPKDTQVLLLAPDFECPSDTDRQYLCCVVQGWFDTAINDQRWYFAGDANCGWPTHWLPLPPPPPAIAQQPKDGQGVGRG